MLPTPERYKNAAMTPTIREGSVMKCFLKVDSNVIYTIIP